MDFPALVSETYLFMVFSIYRVFLAYLISAGQQSPTDRTEAVSILVRKVKLANAIAVGVNKAATIGTFPEVLEKAQQEEETRV